MAEAFYNFYTRSQNACSAGISTTAPAKYPSLLPYEVRQIMLEEDIDIRHHTVKTIEEKLVENATRIFVMCEKEFCPDFLQNSEKVTYWKIENPKNMAIEDMRKIRDQIKVKVSSVIQYA
jgi:protein-tyrosine-phosphatase